MSWFDSLRMKVYREASKSDPSLFDWFALIGIALTVVATIICVVTYWASDVNGRETLFLAKHMPFVVKYCIVHLIFFCLYVNALSNIGRNHKKQYSELSDKEYERVTLASIYTIIISVLTPVTYVYLVFKYTLVAIGLTCKFSFIFLPEYLVHLLFGRKQEKEQKKMVKEVKAEAEVPVKANILSDYNAFLNK